MDANLFYSKIFLICSASIVGCLFFGYPVTALAKWLGLMDIPGSAPHKKHQQATPLAGGLLMLFVFMVLGILFHTYLNREVTIVLSGALIIFFFGFWDDRKGLSAFPKLIGQIFASSVLIFSGLQVQFITALLSPDIFPVTIGQILNIILTLLWLVGITNAMNLIDSMDGVVAGLGMIASSFYVWAAGNAGQQTIALWSAGLFGVCTGLYFWNAIKKRFFLGDSGSQTLGFLLAAFGMLYNPPNQNPASSWMVPVLLLGIPILDTSLVVFSRLRRRQPIWNGRRDHMYHRLIRMGVSPGISVLIVHALALFLSLMAFFTFLLIPLVSLALFIVIIALGFILLIWLDRKPTPDDDP